MVFARKQRLALQHFGENASCTPYVDFDIVLLPREHNLRSSVVSRRYVARHLRILYTRKAKVANLQITILIHEDVARLEIAVDNASRMYVFQTPLYSVRLSRHNVTYCGTYENLVEKILDELLLERSRGQETVEVGAKELGHKVSDYIILAGVCPCAILVAHMSSRGDIKMSLKLMTFVRSASHSTNAKQFCLLHFHDANALEASALGMFASIGRVC